MNDLISRLRAESEAEKARWGKTTYQSELLKEAALALSAAQRLMDGGEQSDGE